MVLDVIIDKLTLCCSKKIVIFFLLTFFCLIRRQAWFGTVFFIVFVIYYVSLHFSNISRLIECEISTLNYVFIFLSTSYSYSFQKKGGWFLKTLNGWKKHFCCCFDKIVLSKGVGAPFLRSRWLSWKSFSFSTPHL
jgi:hypothetical protein